MIKRLKEWLNRLFNPPQPMPVPVPVRVRRK